MLLFYFLTYSSDSFHLLGSSIWKVAIEEISKNKFVQYLLIILQNEVNLFKAIKNAQGNCIEKWAYINITYK